MLCTLLSNQTMASGGEPPPNKPLKQTAAPRRDLRRPLVARGEIPRARSSLPVTLPFADAAAA